MKKYLNLPPSDNMTYFIMSILRKRKHFLNCFKDFIPVLRDLVNTKIPFIVFSYSNILAGEIAHEDISIESKQHIT